MIYTVDRIERNLAVLEAEGMQQMLRVSLAILPKELREGDCLIYIDGEHRL